MSYFLTLFSGEGWASNRQATKKDLENRQAQYVAKGKILQDAAFEEYCNFKPSVDSTHIQLELLNKDYEDLVAMKRQHDKLLLENKKLHEDLRRNQHNLKVTHSAVVSRVDNYKSKGKFFLNSASQMLDTKKAFFSARGHFVRFVKREGPKVKRGFASFADKAHPENNFWNYHGSQLKKCKEIKEAVDAASQVQQKLDAIRSTFAAHHQQVEEHQQVESVVDASNTHAPTAGIVEERGHQNSRRGQPPLQADATDSPRRLWMGGYPNTPLAAIREGTDMELEYTSSEEGDTPLFGMNILERQGPRGGYISPTSTEASIAHYDQEANDAVAGGFLVDNAEANDIFAAGNADVTNVEEAENAVLLWKNKEQMQPGKCGIQECNSESINDVAKVCARHWKAEPERDGKSRLLCRIPGCGKQTIGGDCRCPKHGGKVFMCSVNDCTDRGYGRKLQDISVGKFCKLHWKEKKQSLLAGDDATGNSGVSSSAADENADPQQSNANIVARQHPSISAGDNATGTIGFNSSADGRNRKQCSMYGCKSAANFKSKHGLPGRFCLMCSEQKPTGNSGGSRSADENADPQQSNANISARHL